MRRECSRKGWQGAVGVFAALASFVLVAASARAAEPCKDPSDVAEDAYSTFVDQMSEFSGLNDESMCDKITTTAMSACYKAVSSATKCNQQFYKSVFKAQKLACPTSGAGQASCMEFYTNESDNIQLAIAAAGGQGNEECADDANLFWEICMLGP